MSALEEGSGQGTPEPSPPHPEQVLAVRITHLAQGPLGGQCQPQPAEELLFDWPRVTSSAFAFRGCLPYSMDTCRSVGPKITGCPKAAVVEVEPTVQ